ncbi:hypothetical protein [Xanthobacter sediminis]
MSPPQRITLSEMVHAAGDEAHRIEGSQRALIAAGYRVFPDERQIHKANVFSEIERLLMIFQANEQELRRAIRRLPGHG